MRMKMRRDETVYDRTKKNGGFIDGGGNNMLHTGRMMPKKPMEGESVESEERKDPPNLRNALEESTICGTCSDFEGMSCAKYGADVKFHEGCDDHSSLREEGEEDGAEEETMMEEEEV